MRLLYRFLCNFLCTCTVISDDFGSITCFFATTSADGLAICSPWYPRHRTGPARVSASRFREILRLRGVPPYENTPKSRYYEHARGAIVVSILASLSTLTPRAQALWASQTGPCGAGQRFRMSIGDPAAIPGGTYQLSHCSARMELKWWFVHPGGNVSSLADQRRCIPLPGWAKQTHFGLIWARFDFFDFSPTGAPRPVAGEKSKKLKRAQTKLGRVCFAQPGSGMHLLWSARLETLPPGCTNHHFSAILALQWLSW